MLSSDSTTVPQSIAVNMAMCDVSVHPSEMKAAMLSSDDTTVPQSIAVNMALCDVSVHPS